MSKIAIFPGSFDPITLGHVSIVKRAASLFDKIIVAIGVNSTKSSMFSVEQRKEWIENIFKDYENIEVETYTGLTINYCKKKGAKYILRGLRTSADFEFERGIGQVNFMMEKEIETVFLLTEAKYSPISSSIVRDVYKNGGDLSKLIPAEVIL
ncbi:MAG: pantetheine-phosphate adenylyltransferase [Marinilabiliales bacterium]|nr:MAG: pantetheine-phosphate adenylyltransferase [Marinilabiliales bacterium]